MKRALAAVFLLGCGGAPPPPPAQPVAVTPQPVATAPASRAPLFVEYVVLREAWLAKQLPVDPAALESWAASTGQGGDVFWHILVRGSKKDADAVLADLKKGTPFAREARERSEDPGSASKGGYYLASQVSAFVPEVRDAYAKLKSGATTTQPVKSSYGWHIIRKAPLGVDELEPMYRQAKAPELTTKLASELRARLHAGAEMRPAIADSVTAVLGDLAASDEHRPAPATVERDELKATRLPDAAKTALSRFADTAKAGDVMDDAVVAGGEVIVARAAVR